MMLSSFIHMHHLADSESTLSSVWSSPPTSVCFCTKPEEETTTVSHGADDQGFGIKTCQEAVLSGAAAGEHLISSTQEGKCQAIRFC